jgi:hypothetical protein
MWTLIGYYGEPTQQRNMYECILRRPGRTVYLVNPQLYQEGLPDPILNVGVFPIAFPGSQPPSDEVLIEGLTARLRDGLHTGIKVGQRIIPAENIEILIEKASD